MQEKGVHCEKNYSQMYEHTCLAEAIALRDRISS
jgi:hypothetical protein